MECSTEPGTDLIPACISCLRERAAVAAPDIGGGRFREGLARAITGHGFALSVA